MVALAGERLAGTAERAEPSYDYAGFSRLAGPLEPPPPRAYTVQYRRLPGWRPWRTLALVTAMVCSQAAFLIWLLLPQHWPRPQAVVVLYVISIVMVLTLAVIEIFRLLNVFTVCMATLRARDPIPVVPAPGTRVAFLTTIVPSKEPLAIVVETLAAAMNIFHDGLLDVWLLDEGDDAAVRTACAELGVHHFTRKGVEQWNLPSGPHKAKTKHGNYNAWLEAHGDGYDFLISVDPDHVPLPNICERMLGYFRDPDVAFVVGPQVYGNYDNFVTKCAESQQYLFHSLLQRAGNYVRSPMLVGTNNAMRIAALRDDRRPPGFDHRRPRYEPGLPPRTPTRPPVGGGHPSIRPTCSPSARVRRHGPTSSRSSTDGVAGVTRSFSNSSAARCSASTDGNSFTTSSS